MQVKQSQIQEILSSLPKAKIELDREFDDDIKVSTAQLQCVICYQVPAEPHECLECNALFCFNCIDKLKPTGILVKKCPHCKQQFRFKKISKVFLSLFDSIEFQHDCQQVFHPVTSSPTESGQGEVRQILLNEPHPSHIEENSAIPEPEKDTEPVVEKKKVSPKPPKKKKFKSFKYKDLIYHLEMECPRNKIYTCPQKCHQNSKRIQKKLTKKQVEQHLTKECPKVEVNCLVCGEAFLREAQTTHSCVNYLKQIIQNQNLEIQELKRNQKPSERHTCPGMFKNEIATEIDCQFCSSGQTNVKCLDCGFYVCDTCW